jgi:hypothetical protein
MTIKLVRSDSLYTDAPYAYASIASHGSLIFTAEACPLDDKGEVVGVTALGWPNQLIEIEAVAVAAGTAHMA